MKSSRRTQIRCLISGLCLMLLIGGCGSREQAEDVSTEEQGATEDIGAGISEEQNEAGYLEIEKGGWVETRGYYYLGGRTAKEFVDYVLGEGTYAQTPYAPYVNPEGKLQMALWHNAESNLWCGIRYADRENERSNPNGKTYGFIIDEKENTEEVEQWYLEPLEKTDFGLPLYGYDVQENYEYDDSGRLLSYEVTGDYVAYDWEKEEDVVRESEYFYSVNYTYYDNGMIEKNYHHNSIYFGTGCAFQETVYDENGREVYCFVSVSGAMPSEEYFLYASNSDIPFCRLMIDAGSGATGAARLSFYLPEE